MKPLLSIFKRELLSYFRTSIGWVVTALFLLVAGVFVANGTIVPGQEASLGLFFSLSHWLVLMVAPAISMRLLSEDLRLGTIEPLMTSPASDWTIAFGKYFGGLGFYCLMLAPTLVYVVVLELLADPEPGPILAGYFGLILVGGFYLAAGQFASSLTSNQVVAYLGTLFFFVLLWFISTQVPSMLGSDYEFLYEFSVQLRIADFAKGVIDTAHIAVFAAASLWFVILSVVALELRRWR